MATWENDGIFNFPVDSGNPSGNINVNSAAEAVDINQQPQQENVPEEEGMDADNQNAENEANDKQSDEEVKENNSR